MCVLADVGQKSIGTSGENLKGENLNQIWLTVFCSNCYLETKNGNLKYLISGLVISKYRGTHEFSLSHMGMVGSFQ